MTFGRHIRQRLATANTTIRGRLTLLAVIAVAAFLLAAAVQSLAVREILERVEREEIHRRVHQARRLFARQSEAKATLISEFSFWDDTWNFIDQPNGPAARQFVRENIVDWLPTRYGDQIIEIADRQRKPVLSWTDPAITGGERLLAREEVFQALEQKKLAGGFLATTNGWYLVGGALIMRSNDHELRGPSNGYFIAGQPVDSAMLAQFEDELYESISIVPYPASWPADSVAKRHVGAGDGVEATFALPGIDGEPVGLVVMRTSESFLHRLTTSTYVLLGALALGGVVVFTLLWRAGQRLVILPLGEIGGSLEHMQQRGKMVRLETIPPTREWQLFVSAFNGCIDALQSSEKRYRVLFDHAADAHFLLDARDQTILEANPAALALAGCAPPEIIGHEFAKVLELEQSPDHQGAFRLRRRDGSLLVVSVVTAELEIGGEPRQLVSFRDLTNHEALSAQLRQAQKMEAIGSLAGGVAHDFNNLLGAVLMAASTLRADTEGNKASGESIDTIEHAARRAAELTKSLLRFARRDQEQKTAVALNEVVTNVARLCQRTFDRAIVIEAKTESDLPDIVGDPGHLEQALLNLCINARDAMPSGGVLRLSTERRELDSAAASSLPDIRPGSYVVVRVSDSGLGLTRAAEQHLFEPFFTTKGQGKGTGLGLPMVYGIVRNHGGTIQVKNRPGHGASFVLFLPVASGPVEPPVAVAPLVTSMPRGVERILVIDDEPALRSVVQRALSRLGYTVDVAENGKLGVEMLAARPDGYGLILLDMVMPDIGGAETFQRLRRITPDIPVLICSGYSAETERLELLESGADGFLPKPFDTFELANRVREILDGVAVPSASA